MTELETNVTLFRGALVWLTGLSLIFVIMCTGTTHWVEKEELTIKTNYSTDYSSSYEKKAQVQTTLTIHSGIFKECYKRTVKRPQGGTESISSNCSEYTKMKLHCTCCIKVVQAFMMTGIFSYVAVFVAIFLAVFKEKSMNIVGGTLLISFIICSIGLSIYAGSIYADLSTGLSTYAREQKLDGSYADEQKLDGSYADEQKLDGSYAREQKLDSSVPRINIQEGYTHGWSFIVGWLGVALALIAGVIAFVAAVKEAPCETLGHSVLPRPICNHGNERL